MDLSIQKTLKNGDLNQELRIFVEVYPCYHDNLGPNHFRNWFYIKDITILERYIATNKGDIVILK